MLSSSSSAAALERGSSSSFSKVLLRGGSSSSSFSPSRKRGRKWFRPRLVALTLLLAAVWGRESAEESQQLRKGEPPLLASFPQPPYSFAHRGASGLLPEHTMQAYALAVEQVSCFFQFFSPGLRERERERERRPSFFATFFSGREGALELKQLFSRWPSIAQRRKRLSSRLASFQTRCETLLTSAGR